MRNARQSVNRTHYSSKSPVHSTKQIFHTYNTSQSYFVPPRLLHVTSNSRDYEWVCKVYPFLPLHIFTFRLQLMSNETPNLSHLRLKNSITFTSRFHSRSIQYHRLKLNPCRPFFDCVTSSA